MSFWALRAESYRAVWVNPGARVVVAWDAGRVLVWAAFFGLGLFAHDAFVNAANGSAALRFMVAVATFGTFLASFVLSVMSTTGKRELDLARDAAGVNATEQRLRWLLSDQLIMVVSALATAAFALVWLGIAGVGEQPHALLSALVLAFSGLCVFNALRLPFQIWELQSTALSEERQRAFDRLNAEANDLFGPDRK